MLLITASFMIRIVLLLHDITQQILETLHWQTLKESFRRKKYENNFHMEELVSNWLLTQPTTFYFSSLANVMEIRQKNKITFDFLNIPVVNLFLKSLFHHKNKSTRAVVQKTYYLLKQYILFFFEKISNYLPLVYLLGCNILRVHYNNIVFLSYHFIQITAKKKI